MSILLSSTLANESTSYYALAGAGGGGVGSLNGLSGALSLASGDGSVTITPAGSSINLAVASGIPAVASPTTLTSLWGSAPYPTGAAAGVDGTQTFIAPRSGVYLVECGFGFNVNPESVVVGNSDLVTAGLAIVSPISVLGAGTIHPVPMASTGADYGLQSSFFVTLVAGQAYALTKFVTDISTTLVLGAASSSVSLKIVPLC